MKRGCGEDKYVGERRNQLRHGMILAVLGGGAYILYLNPRPVEGLHCLLCMVVIKPMAKVNHATEFSLLGNHMTIAITDCTPLRRLVASSLAIRLVKDQELVGF